MRSLLTSNATAIFRTACCLIGLVAASPLHAQTTALERVALHGGRVMAAARICRITAERIRSTSERLLRLMNERAASAEEKTSIAKLFAQAQSDQGPARPVSHAQCTGLHVAFSEMEVGLRRPAAPTNVAAVPRRNGPVPGARHPGIAAVELRP